MPNAKRRQTFGLECLTAAFASIALNVAAETQPLIYFPGEGSKPATAQLRVDGDVVVSIGCDGPQRLRFDFPLNDGYPSLPLIERQKPLEFGFDEASNYVLPTADKPGYLVGRLQLTPKVMGELYSSKFAWFWGPSEMGEPWPVVNVDALRALVGSCSRGR